jgi:hypothetical protein
MASFRTSGTNFDRPGDRDLGKGAIELLPWTRHEWIAIIRR